MQLTTEIQALKDYFNQQGYRVAIAPREERPGYVLKFYREPQTMGTAPKLMPLKTDSFFPRTLIVFKEHAIAGFTVRFSDFSKTWRNTIDTYNVESSRFVGTIFSDEVEALEAYIEDALVECPECGLLHDREGEFFADDACCQECSEALLESNEVIREYHDNPDCVFVGEQGNTDKELWLGVELEMESPQRHLLANQIASMYGDDRVWFQYDSSLSSGEGVELTTQPMSLPYHIESDFWKDVTRIASDCDAQSHNGGRCGLHVHVNRDFFDTRKALQNVAALKMFTALSRFKSQTGILSRRELRLHDGELWIRNSYSASCDLKNEGIESMNRLKDKLDLLTSANDRYRALNTNNARTLELRFFRGTLRIDSLKACLEFAAGLALLAKSKSMSWFKTCTWYEFIDEMAHALDAAHYSSANLYPYLEERGLSMYENLDRLSDNIRYGN